jgi:chloramphenicol O-acetyltransferase type A
MKHLLDLQNWPRREHFNFFRQFEEPFFGVTAIVDCTIAYEKAKTQGDSFFLYYLHKTLAAVNAVEAFRYRIAGNDVVVYDVVNVSATINKPDGSFGLSHMEYHHDFSEFSSVANVEIERVQSSAGLFPPISSENIIHFSALPWINFTSLSHARSFSFKDCIPKISYGKMSEVNTVKTMPISIHVHHALMDGYHVGVFLDTLQQLLNE